MARRQLASVRPQEKKTQREVQDLRLVLQARNGNEAALDALIRRYTGFVRLKASSYFLAGGEGDDLIQEGLIGLYKAVRDFRSDKDTSFRTSRSSASRGRSSPRRSRPPLASSTRRSTHTSRSARPPPARRRGSARSAMRCPGPASTTLPSASSRRRSSRASSSVWGPACRRWRATRFASTSRATPTRRWRSFSAATQRRSTTRSSASSARSSCTSRAARFSTTSRGPVETRRATMRRRYRSHFAE